MRLAIRRAAAMFGAALLVSLSYASPAQAAVPGTPDKLELTAGVQVIALQTQAGKLPIVGDPFLSAAITAAAGTAYGFSAVPAGLKGYYAVIVTETEIEMPVIHGGDGNLQPRLFQLGLLAGLQGQYVGIVFDSVVVKGATYAHRLIQVLRP